MCPVLCRLPVAPFVVLDTEDVRVCGFSFLLSSGMTLFPVDTSDLIALPFRWSECSPLCMGSVGS